MEQSIFDAARQGNIEAADRCLQAGADVNAASREREAWTPLIVAAGHGHLEMVRHLLARGADVNGCVPRGEYRGWTPLMRASWGGHPEVARLLVDSGADVNLANDYGGTALMHASVEGHPSVVRLLLASGARVDAEDNNGLTAMMLAAIAGTEETVRLLLENGAAVDHRAGSMAGGGTALMMAAHEKHTRVVHILLDYGADSRVRNMYGLDALTIAQRVEPDHHPDARKGQSALRLALHDSNVLFVTGTRQRMSARAMHLAVKPWPVLPGGGWGCPKRSDTHAPP